MYAVTKKEQETVGSIIPIVYQRFSENNTPLQNFYLNRFLASLFWRSM